MILKNYPILLLLFFSSMCTAPKAFNQKATSSNYRADSTHTTTAAYQQIKQRSTLWNAAYNKRDSTTFYTLMDTAIIISSATGVQMGKESCKNICSKLYPLRPDITWINEPVSIDINSQWQLAFETGN